MLISRAQKYDIPLNHNISEELILVKTDKDSLFHIGIKPYNQWFLSDQSFNKVFKDTGDYYYDFTVLLYQKHLLEIHQKDVHIGMDVLLDFYLGQRYYESQADHTRKVSTNTRGFRIVANIGKKVSFETRFYENQFFYPNYVDSIVTFSKVAPGIGRVKPFKTIGWDVGNSMGVVGLKLNDLMNLKFGHDKLFIGHGYRSLLLSDNTSNYPLLMLNLRSKNRKWQYMSTLAWMQSLKRSETIISTEALFKRKNANFHYLSYKPSNQLEFGIFEGTIYKVYDDSLGHTAPDPTFYNPIIGINTALNGLQGENNSVVGISAAYTSRALQVYSQLAIDDLDKIAFQIGGTWFEPFGLKRNWLQLEFNSAPSFMYSHNQANILQSYTHMNQSLAHPLGASFSEIVWLYHFEKDGWFTNAQVNYTFRRRGSNKQMGENILYANDHPALDDMTYQKVQTLYWQLEGGYRFNIKTRLQLFGQVTQRTLNNLYNSESDQQDFYFVVGIRCNLNNYYLDL